MPYVLATEVEAAISPDVAGDPDRWSHSVGQTADLLAVLAQFDFGHDRLQRVADQLARAAQLEHGQRRPQPRQSGITSPLLVAAARAAAVCRDPARVVLAAVVLLIWSIVKTLPRTAEGRHHQPRASARQHIAAAADELADHPILRSNGGAKAEAPSWSKTGVRKPVAQKSSAPSSVLDLDRRPTVHKPATPRTGGRTR